MTGEIRRGDSGPVALHTRLGWVLSGPMTLTGPTTSVLSLATTHTLRVDAEPENLKKLDYRLHSFWNLESLGICDSENPLLEEFDKTISFKEGRYEVSLPWREAHPPLPTNRDMTSKRLQGLVRRLRQDPPILREYDKIIQDQIMKGIVQIVEPLRDVELKLHYLPNHAVVRRDKDTIKVTMHLQDRLDHHLMTAYMQGQSSTKGYWTF